VVLEYFRVNQFEVTQYMPGLGSTSLVLGDSSFEVIGDAYIPLSRFASEDVEGDVLHPVARQESGKGFWEVEKLQMVDIKGEIWWRRRELNPGAQNNVL